MSQPPECIRTLSSRSQSDQSDCECWMVIHSAATVHAVMHLPQAPIKEEESMIRSGTVAEQRHSNTLSKIKHKEVETRYAAKIVKARSIGYSNP